MSGYSEKNKMRVTQLAGAVCLAHGDWIKGSQIGKLILVALEYAKDCMHERDEDTADIEEQISITLERYVL